MPSPIATHAYIFPADVIRQSPDDLLAKGWPSYVGEEYVDLGLDSNVIKGQESQLIAALSSGPSLSLVLPFDSLLDGDRGIFANPRKTGREWERPVAVELI